MLGIIAQAAPVHSTWASRELTGTSPAKESIKIGKIFPTLKLRQVYIITPFSLDGNRWKFLSES
ncbi:hypothetical protein LEP1GSC193_2248 [Leptospira alstonii serovar Pingchang str. 80-412]|uniref:Uncharacterized protein n=2 Tax=Leptospira alstonii TaxID=28452 RepID=M6CWR9_9LEPT|nr:hypothetical protein LEP1GSC194_0350 [Leptospira alstonii serovar Sichuan str. 79601]EQA79939.1 hypothetical protein LEP1GSC193_2248 [Leptospira alstonii serovar Pingchang str. 80-412]